MFDQSKLFAGTLLVVTFVAGAAVGIALSGAWDDGDDDRRHRGRERLSYTERLDQALDLTSAQRESISALMDRRQATMRGIWHEIEPRFDSLRAQIRSEILALLDETQQQKFAKLIARSDSARAARERRGSGERRERESHEKR